MTSASDNLAALVDDMLQDAGAGQDAELRDTLVALGALASLPVPPPTGKLAALLAAGGPAEDAVSGTLQVGQPDALRDGPPDDELARRRRRHRPTALGLVLVAGMGLGVGGVAASSTAPGNSTIEQVLADWVPWSRAAGGAPAAASGYRTPEATADGEVAQSAATAAPSGTADGSHRASRFLRNPAGLFNRIRIPACAGSVKHDAATAPGSCAAEPGAVALDGADGGKDGSGRVAAAGTPAGPAVPGAGKAGEPATAAGGADRAGAAQKAAGSATDRGPGQGQSQDTWAQEAGEQGSASQNAGPKAATPVR